MELPPVHPDFESAYTDSTPTVPSSRSGRIASWLTGTDEYVPPEVADRRALEVADRSRVARVDRILANPAVGDEQVVQRIAEQQGTDRGPDATLGMVEILAEQGGEEVPAAARSPSAYQARRQRLQAEIRQRLDDSTAETDAYYNSLQSRAKGRGVMAGAGPILGSVLATSTGGKGEALAAKVGDLAQTMVPEIFVPETQYHVIQIMKKYAPDSEWGDLFDKREVFVSAAKTIAALPVEEQRAAIDEIVSSAEENSGWFGNNPANKQRMVRDMLGAIAEGEVGDVDALFHALSFIGPVDAAIGATNLGLRGAIAGVNLATDAVRAGQGGLRAAGGALDAGQGRRLVAPAPAPPAALPELGPSAIKEQELILGGAVTEGKGLPIFNYTEVPTAKALSDRLKEVRSQLDQLPRTASKGDEGLESQRTALVRGLQELQNLRRDLKSGALKPGQPVVSVVREGGDKVFSVQAMQMSRIFVASAPQISPGSVADAATMTTQGAKTAVSLALQGDGGAGALVARGTNVEDVIGSLVVPKIATGLDDLGKPQVNPVMWTDDALRETEERVAAGLTQALQTRLKDTVLRTTEKGIEYTATLGNTGGKGYASAQAAQDAATPVFGANNFSVVQAPDGGGFFVQITGNAAPLPQPGRPDNDWVERGAWWKRWLSVQNAFTQSFQSLRVAAQRQTDLGEAAAKASLEPLDALPFYSRANVHKLIDEGDRTRTSFTRAQAEAKLNQNQAEVDAYMAYKAFAHKSHGLVNANTRNYMLGEGAFDGRVANAWVPMKPAPGSLSVTTFVDSITGNIVTGKQAGDQVFQLYSPIKNSNYVIRRANSGAQPSRQLPQQVVGFPPGFVARANSFSHYGLDEEGRALYGARSELEARRKQAEIIQQDPTRVIAIRQATEAQRGGTTEGNIQNLLSQGLFYHQPIRGSSVLKGVDGVERVTGIDEGIAQMVRQYGLNSGVNKWADEVVREAKYLVKDIPGVEIGVGVRVIPDTLEDLQAARVAGAQRLVEWVETVQGVGAIQLNHSIRTVTVPIGNAILNGAQRVAVPYTPVAPLARFFADNMLGVTDNAIALARKVAFYTLLAPSVLRNWYVQTSMISQYTALKGAYKYLFSPTGYATDAPLLMASALAGKPAPGAARLYKLWKDTGLEQSAKGHPLILSTIGQSRAGTNLANTVSRGILDSVSKFGFQAPVTVDRMNAFLFSLQKWKVTTGKKWPTSEAEIDAVRLLTDTNALDPTVTGALAIEKGMLGLGMQFLSFTAKTFARPFQKDLSAGERVRMGLHQLAFYGASGIGAGNVFDKMFPDAADSVREAFIGGLNDVVLNTVLDAWVGDEGSDVNASAHVSPLSGLGKISDTASTIIKAFATSGLSGILESPASSTLGRFVSAAKFGSWLALEAEAPVGVKLQALKTEMIKVFPVGNSLLRAHIANTRGILTDSRGTPVTDAGDKGFVAALYSMPTYDEQELRELREISYKEYNDASDLAIMDAWTDLAKENATKMAKLIEAAGGNDQLTELQVSNMVYGHAVLMQGILGDHEVQGYHRAVMKQLDVLELFTDAKYAEGLLKAAKIGKLRRTPENLALLAANKTPGAAEVLDFWNRQEEASRNFTLPED